MNCNDRIPLIVVARKQGFGFKVIDALTEGIDLAAQVGLDVFAFFCEVEIGRNVFRAAQEVGLVGEHAFETLLLAHDLLRALRIRPQVGIGSVLIYFCELMTELVRVKDTPGVRGLSAASLNIPARVPESCFAFSGSE
jgi:hypothetical protein